MFLKRKLRAYAFLIQYLFKKIVYYVRRKLPGLGKLYAQHFPATHLTPDRWQYLCNFSSELLVTILVVIVAGFNVVFFFFKSDFHDNSLLFTFLKRHVSFNEKLYARNSS